MTYSSYILTYFQLETIFKIQVVIVILTLIATYLSYALISSKEARLAKQKKALSNIIESHLKISQPIMPAEMPKNCMNFLIIIPVLNHLYSKYDKANLQPILISLYEKELLSLANKYCKKFSWLKRDLAMQLFMLYSTPQIEECIFGAMNDPVPLVAIHAVLAGINLGTKRMINKTIDVIMQGRRFSQEIYLTYFKTANPKTRDFIEERISNSTDPYLKACCYRILFAYKNPYISLSKKDVLSDNLELRIAATKNLASAEKIDIDLLKKLFHDISWQVRAIVANIIGKNKLNKLIPELTMHLNDDAWWVRYNSAMALKNMGEKGIKILSNLNPNSIKFAYEIANYVLNSTLQLKESG